MVRSLFVGFAASLLGLMAAPNDSVTGSWLKAGLDPVIERDPIEGKIRITFEGALEWAPGLAGPWLPLPEAASPYVVDPGADQRLYRTRESAEVSVFSSRTIVNWTVSGPLQTHFDLAFAGLPDGIFPPLREKPYFPGTLTMGEHTLAVEWRVRGNSSLQECPFPKLKVKISRSQREGTPFFDAREIKVGTHCAEGGRGSIGRLRDERATYREAMAYEALAALGFVAPRVRRARIEFRDTSPTDAPNPGGWQITRNALIFDDQEVLAERLGGRALDDDEKSALKNANFGHQLVTDIKFFHILLGNWDYTLSEDGAETWNADVIQLADGTHLPIPGDFDLSSWVTEEIVSNAPWDYLPELPELDRRARYELREIRRQVARPIFDAARARFEAKRAALDELVETAAVDEAGRANARQHLAAFFGALAAGGD